MDDDEANRPTQSDHQNIAVREILINALESPDPEEQKRYLDRACGDDQKLRELLQSLVKAHDEADQFLNRSVFGEEMDPLSEGPGTVIGEYKLLEKIGEGGSGVVYMAEQEEPVRRRVALKIIKLGMDTKQVVARFEAERQALAMMDHPNIANIFGGGSTTSGRPYFSMELVRGSPITEYFDEHQLTTEERLNLFIQVCHAVYHAHQKGGIHRDLKPSNVIVVMHDDKPVPKVIDFGIAKATQAKLTEKTYLLIHRVRQIGLKGTHQARASCGSLRLRLFKIGSLVKVSVRRVVVSLSSAYPWRELFEQTAHRLAVGPAG